MHDPLFNIAVAAALHTVPLTSKHFAKHAKFRHAKFTLDCRKAQRHESEKLHRATEIPRKQDSAPI